MQRGALTCRAGALVSIRAPPRAGRRPFCVWIVSVMDVFRSAPPRRGRPGGQPPIFEPILFRSAPPRRGDGLGSRCPSARTRSFDPRPRAGGDRALGIVGDLDMVSIRAPARTGDHRAGRERGAGGSFDPRPRAGAAHARCRRHHARWFPITRPPRSGRPGGFAGSNLRYGFDPRPPRAVGRVDSVVAAALPSCFDPRPARERDFFNPSAEPGHRRCCFDPRPRAGGDAQRQRLRRVGRRFDPRPREGAHPTRRLVLTPGIAVSIRAPAQGATATTTTSL